MSETTDPELYSLITNVCKPLKSFDTSETDHPLGFLGLKSFPGFVIISERTEPIVSLLLYFVIKMRGNIFMDF